MNSDNLFMLDFKMPGGVSMAVLSTIDVVKQLRVGNEEPSWFVLCGVHSAKSETSVLKEIKGQPLTLTAITILVYHVENNEY